MDLAFLDALAAPAFVRIAGAMNMGGGPIPTINGDYEKTTDMRNGRAVYKKVGDDKRAMWMGPNGIWYMGHVGEGGKNVGGTSTGAMAAGKAGNETSPDLVSSEWKVGPASFGGKGSEFVPQTNISVGAVSAAEVAEARRVEEEEGAASLDRAAQYVRVAGATDKSGERIRTINGDYEKTTDMRNGRAVYKKVGDDKRAMWMGPNGVWHMGHVGEGEKKLGGTSNAAMAAGKVENETSPDLDRSAMGGRLHRASWGGAVAGSFSRRACRWWRSRTRWWRVGKPPLPPASACQGSCVTTAWPVTPSTGTMTSFPARVVAMSCTPRSTTLSMPCGIRQVRRDGSWGPPLWPEVRKDWPFSRALNPGSACRRSRPRVSGSWGAVRVRNQRQRLRLCSSSTHGGPRCQSRALPQTLGRMWLGGAAR